MNELIPVGVGIVVVVSLYVVLSRRGDDEGKSSTTDGSSASDNPERQSSSESSGSAASSAGRDASGDTHASAESGSSGSGSSPSRPDSSNGVTQRSSTLTSGRSPGSADSTSTGARNEHTGADVSSSGSNGGSGTPATTDDNDLTRVYGVDTNTRRGPAVYLRIEGERIEIPEGEAIGRKLRSHLVKRGVPEQKALAVSRDHFEVTTDDGVKIRDTGSTGGTVLKGTRLTPYQWESLSDGDEVVLAGQLRGYFEITN